MAVIRDVMQAFELVQPNSIADEQRVLEQQGEKGWVLAGGMDSFDWLKDRIKKPNVVIDLSGIAELKGIRISKREFASRSVTFGLFRPRETRSSTKWTAIMAERGGFRPRTLRNSQWR